MAKDLRTIVAEMAKVPVGEIGPGFSLQSQAFASSIKKAALVASIRRHLGVDCMRAALAKDFAELEQMVQGSAAAPAGPAATPPLQVGALAAQARELGLACGIDLEEVAALPQTQDFLTHEFYLRNFSEAERAYCAVQAEPRTHFAARWAAKEALRKCDPAFSAEPMDRVEVARAADGRPFLRRLPSGEALPHAVSLTHTPALAAAVVIHPGPPRGLWGRLLGR